MENNTAQATEVPERLADNPEFHLEEIPQPLGSKVLVRRDEAAEKTLGGILLPEAAQTKPKRGRVMAVGPGRVLEDGSRAPMDIEAGDHVWFSSYAGTDLAGVEAESGFVIMDIDDILAVRPPAEEE